MTKLEKLLIKLRKMEKKIDAVKLRYIKANKEWEDDLPELYKQHDRHYEIGCKYSREVNDPLVYTMWDAENDYKDLLEKSTEILLELKPEILEYFKKNKINN